MRAITLDRYVILYDHPDGATNIMDHFIEISNTQYGKVAMVPNGTDVQVKEIKDNTAICETGDITFEADLNLIKLVKYDSKFDEEQYHKYIILKESVSTLSSAITYIDHHINDLDDYLGLEFDAVLKHDIEFLYNKHRPNEVLGFTKSPNENKNHISFDYEVAPAGEKVRILYESHDDYDGDDMFIITRADGRKSWCDKKSFFIRVDEDQATLINRIDSIQEKYAELKDTAKLNLESILVKGGCNG